MKIVSTTKTASFVKVTPALAAKWLESNNDNRKQRGKYVRDIAAAMRRGEWQTTHQGIAFAKCGKLLDGQHRLEAIVKAEVELDMLVITGLTSETFSVIDVGTKRSMTDVTNLSTRTAEVCNFLCKVVGGGSQPTAAQVSAMAACGVGRIHEKLLEHCGAKRAYYGSAPIRCAAVTLVMNGHNQDKVFDAYADLVLENFNRMPMIAQSLVRLVNAKKVAATNKRVTYANGLKVLNPENGSIARFKLTEEDIEAAYTYGKATLKRALA